MEPVNPYAAPQAAVERVAADVASQPLTLVGALQAGTSLFFRRFPAVAAITLTIWAPLNAIVTYLEYFVLDSEDVMGAVRLNIFAEALIGIIAAGGIISVAEAELRGLHRGPLAALVDGLAGWPRLFSSRFVGGLFILIAVIFFVLPAIYLGVRYSLSDCAALIERRAGLSAINRSMELTRGRFLIFFGLCVVTVVPVVITGSVILMPLQFFPEYDHWLLAAALSCLVDLLDAWMTLIFVAAYVQCGATKPSE
jgi:hypothetical protein